MSEKIILDQLVEAQRGIKSTFGKLAEELKEESKRGLVAGDIESSGTTILTVMRAVLILTDKEKN